MRDSTIEVEATDSTLPAGERLRRVEDLYKQGLISKREYERLRREILDQL